MTSFDDDLGLRDLALSAIPSVWAAMDAPARDNVIDLLDSPSLDRGLAARIRTELSSHAA